MDNTCPVCLESMTGRNMFTTRCGHQFCADCIVNNMEYATTCPLCRDNLDIELRNVNNDWDNRVRIERRNNRDRTQEHVIRILEVDRVIDHLERCVNLNVNHSRIRFWNDLAVIFNGIFTRNNVLDRETRAELQREISNAANFNLEQAMNDFIRDDIRDYLQNLVDNLEIDTEREDILNTLDELRYGPNELLEINENIINDNERLEIRNIDNNIRNIY